MTNATIKIFDSIEELNLFAREEVARIALQAIAERGLFTIALSGGSTPKKLYNLLSEKGFQGGINWQQTHFFFGDERFVLPDDAESNYRMANESLFSRIDVPSQNIHRFETEQGSAETVAAKMENELHEFFGLAENEFPAFDLILLGMGADGHTASLFPESAAIQEAKRLVTENYVEKFQTFRLTFTVPTINNARNVIFLVAGEDKAGAAREVLQGNSNGRKYPSQLIKPANGNLTFLLDAKAAALLNFD